MPDLTFAVEGAAPLPFAAAPTLAFKLRIANFLQGEHIKNVLLTCQIQIELDAPPLYSRRATSAGGPLRRTGRWSQTLRTMLWTHATVTVPPFDGEANVDLLVACTFDFNVAATKYFHGLDAGEVPLDLLFSGTIFFADVDGQLRMTRIPWTKEARYRLPVAVWKEMMNLYYPNHAWLCLERDAFEQLYDYKHRRGLPKWEQAIEELISAQRAGRAEVSGRRTSSGRKPQS